MTDWLAVESGSVAGGCESLKAVRVDVWPPDTLSHHYNTILKTSVSRIRKPSRS